jgi:hypothetical protein
MISATDGIICALIFNHCRFSHQTQQLIPGNGHYIYKLHKTSKIMPDGDGD